MPPVAHSLFSLLSIAYLAVLLSTGNPVYAQDQINVPVNDTDWAITGTLMRITTLGNYADNWFK
jgi:hypothetical protein